ncbi:MAG: type II toxin-antitoxin system VapB family antitoxin [Acidobacteria bacterium]|nr:MAG: type II toxin-antitoxin system VapB family antitoxin [Acidobacteriota bacterium]
MRTTLDIPEDLLNDAQMTLGFRSKTDTVIMALRTLVRHHRVEELKGLMGKVRLDIDIPGSRRRPATK